MPKRKRRSDEQSLYKGFKPRSKDFKAKVGDKSETNDASIWVQCENKNCLKWRKITSEELEKVVNKSIIEC
jgi:hypothetical protein